MRRASILKKSILWASGVALLIASMWYCQGFSMSTATTARPAGLADADALTGGVIRAEGRLVAYPGAEVVVGTEIDAALVRLSVAEKDVVRKGDLIAELSSDEHRAALAEAEARIAEVEAEIRFLELDLQRVKNLWSTRAMAKDAFDRAQRDYDTALARRDVARAIARRLQAVVAKTRILSPIDGVVIARYVQPGEMVERGARLVTVADLKRTRVEAEIDEFDAGKLALGAEAVVTAEGFPDASWRGKVEEIPDSIAQRRLRPQDPGRPSDTRVLLVKIALSEATPLKLGQRVELDIRGPSR